MYFALLKFFKYGNFDALPQLGNNHNLDPKSVQLTVKNDKECYNFFFNSQNNKLKKLKYQFPPAKQEVNTN
jgi:hypothetical protein